MFRRRAVSVTDRRVRTMNEVLTCIKLIKMYAWEESFEKSITGGSSVHSCYFHPFSPFSQQCFNYLFKSRHQEKREAAITKGWLCSEFKLFTNNDSSHTSDHRHLHRPHSTETATSTFYCKCKKQTRNMSRKYFIHLKNLIKMLFWGFWFSSKES